MMEYVAGFLFANNYELVALIEKQKPAWQKGKINAIGGKIEPGETPAEAMRREFREETGVDVETWRRYVVLNGPGFIVHFFFSTVTEDELWEVKTTTDEVVGVYDVADLDTVNTIPNLKWLIPMAMSMRYETAAAFDVSEVSHEANL
jgi:8-oxo-dGTP diphosphatase